VFRDGESRTGYQVVKAPRKVAFLLASSLAKPKYEPKGRSFALEASARAELEAKASAILSAGIEKGHDAIVLSAFGCGFNQAPPQAVAAVFRDLLTGKFSNTYKVCFSSFSEKLFFQKRENFRFCLLFDRPLAARDLCDHRGRELHEIPQSEREFGALSTRVPHGQQERTRGSQGQVLFEVIVPGRPQ
jgi:hypothetical protein